MHMKHFVVTWRTCVRSHLLEELVHEVVPVDLHHLLIVIAVLSLQTHRKHVRTSCDASDTQETRQDVM